MTAHEMIEGVDFMPDGWCSACDACGSAPMICAACSYDKAGQLLQPVRWPWGVACDPAAAAEVVR